MVTQNPSGTRPVSSMPVISTTDWPGRRSVCGAIHKSGFAPYRGVMRRRQHLSDPIVSALILAVGLVPIVLLAVIMVMLGY